MFKTLLKKQFYELNAAFFQSRKDGKRKTKTKTILTIIGFAVLMIIVSFALFIMTGMIGDTLLSLPTTEMDWFYFALMGLASILIGVFGSVFNAMAAVYKPKDNELLLSMPIPPSYILIVRMISIYAMSLLYTAIMWVPTMVRYWIYRGITGLSVLNGILLLLLISLLATVLACAAGAVVALISGKLRNRSIVTVIIGLIFFGFYYFVCFRLNSILAMILTNSEKIGTTLRIWVFPVYELGWAATGAALPMLIFAVIVLALFALCCVIMSKSFIRITTLNKGEKKVVYKEQTSRVQSVKDALFKRELGRFTKSSTYMLNCGLGLIMLPAVAILICINRNAILDVTGKVFAGTTWLAPLLYVAVCSALCIILTLNLTTAPSVSLEGKTIWIVQSLPVRTIDILHAKERLHVTLNLIPAVFSSILICWALKFEWIYFLLITANAVLFVIFFGLFGLKRNLKNPNLSWTSEQVPIKQGMPVMISMFGGWLLCLIPTGIYLLIIYFLEMNPAVYLFICTGVLILGIFLIERWLKKKGTIIFEQL